MSNLSKLLHVEKNSDLILFFLLNILTKLCCKKIHLALGQDYVFET